MDGQKCVLCRFWLGRGDSVPLVPVDNPNVEGFCRRFPPRIIELTERMGSVPGIPAGYWCGEYQPANPEAVTEGAATMARLVLLGDLTAARALADKLREDA